MRPPSTLCAALSSLSIAHLIFCVADVVLQQIETCPLTSVNIFWCGFRKKVQVWIWLPSAKRLRNTVIGQRREFYGLKFVKQLHQFICSRFFFVFVTTNISTHAFIIEWESKRLFMTKLRALFQVLNISILQQQNFKNFSKEFFPFYHPIF